MSQLHPIIQYGTIYPSGGGDRLAGVVRTRPGLFFGSTKAGGIHTWLGLLLADAVREFEAGHSTFLSLALQDHGVFEIREDGRPVAQRSWSQLKDSDPEPTGATATDEQIAAVVCQEVRIQRVRGVNRLRLQLDPLFDAAALSREALTMWLRDEAALTPGWRVTLIDQRGGVNVANTWHFPEGLKTLAEGIYYRWEHAFSEFAGTHDGIEVRGAISFLPRNLGVQVVSYANRLRTLAGGAHVDGLLEGLRQLGQSKDDAIGVLCVNVPKPMYAGSTKDRLAGEEVAGAVAEVVIQSGLELRD